MTQNESILRGAEMFQRHLLSGCRALRQDVGQGIRRRQRLLWRL